MSRLNKTPRANCNIMQIKEKNKKIRHLPNGTPNKLLEKKFQHRTLVYKCKLNIDRHILCPSFKNT